MASTVSERFVNNFFSIMVARVAMIVTPVLLSIFAWIGIEVWADYKSEIAAIKVNDDRQNAELQDHESRLKFAAEQADKSFGQIDQRFLDLTGSLKDMNTQIGSINGSIIRLQTTIENRLPPRSSKNDPDAQPTQQ